MQCGLVFRLQLCVHASVTDRTGTNSTCRNRDGYCGDKSAFLSVYIFVYFVSQLYKIAAQVSSTLHGAADSTELSIMFKQEAVNVGSTRSLKETRMVL